MQEKKHEQRDNLLALAFAFMLATIVFLLIYQGGSWLVHDKPLAFFCGLVFSLLSLVTLREDLLLFLKKSN